MDNLSMTSAPVIRIHLGDKRVRTQSTVHQSLHGLNEAFGYLNVFDEVLLKPGHSLKHTITQDGLFFLLPVVGMSEVIHETKRTSDAGNLYFNRVRAGTHIEIVNPYETEWTSFLLWELAGSNGEGMALEEFNLVANANNLVRLFKGSVGDSRIAVRAGMFDGRSEGELSLPNAGHFIFVLEGAFEVQNRLLHARDALSLPSCSHLEFEALSNNAILLIVSQF
ncbi:MAG: hypothetical protein KIT62_16480 [Cyclobacteriaceae bacterium]|nr:hypothetical protein [Cyclobacteriaceae bacterium]